MIVSILYLNIRFISLNVQHKYNKKAKKTKKKAILVDSQKTSAIYLIHLTG